ncbi:MAG: hypothetical protein M3O91_01440 [Chloroflexota bacterium]|nr:hypothetical protein [Chloroflexota bacterium]
MTLAPRAFLGGLGEAVPQLLPIGLAEPRQSAGASLAQFWYGNRALHFDCVNVSVADQG